MTLSIRLNGEDYKGFTEASVTRDIETCSGLFTFVTTVGKTNGEVDFIPIQEGGLVEIIADNSYKIMTGYVDEYGISYNSSSHKITVKGRSKTQDFIDSTMGEIKEFETISLYDLVRLVANTFGLNVIDEVGNLPILQDIASAELGQTAFQFVEKFVQKRQVLLTDNGNGELVLTRASEELSNNSLLNLVNGRNNNIKSASRKTNISSLFYKYIAQSQGSPITASDLEGASDLTELFGETIDEEIRTTRTHEFYSEESTEAFSLEDRAKWEMAIRRARNFTYQATVAGHTFNGELWKPNIRHQIDDDFCNIHGQFLLKRVIYKYGLQNGPETDLIFTNKNSYTLKSELDKIKLEIEEGF